MDQQFFGIDFGVMRVMCWPGWCGKKSVCWKCGEQGVSSGRRVHLLDAGFWSTCSSRGGLEEAFRVWKQSGMWKASLEEKSSLQSEDDGKRGFQEETGFLQVSREADLQRGC